MEPVPRIIYQNSSRDGLEWLLSTPVVTDSDEYARQCVRHIHRRFRRRVEVESFLAADQHSEIRDPQRVRVSRRDANLASNARVCVPRVIEISQRGCCSAAVE